MLVEINCPNKTKEQIEIIEDEVKLVNDISHESKSESVTEILTIGLATSNNNRLEDIKTEISPFIQLSLATNFRSIYAGFMNAKDIIVGLRNFFDSCFLPNTSMQSFFQEYSYSMWS